MLHKLISRFYKRDIDPDRAGRVYHEYDVDRGYGAYAEHCRSRCHHERPPPEHDDLLRDGFVYLNVQSADTTGQILGYLEDHYEPSHIKKDTRDLEGFHVEDRDFLRQTLSSILNDAVDQQLYAFFRSEYLVHTVTFTRTPAADEQRLVSFRWHCDKGPTGHLKLILYLNPTAEHGGNTEFVNLEETAAVARRGYLFGLSGARTSDTAHLSQIAGSEVHVHSRPMAAGDAVIFQPANVLHRGISPRRAARDVVTLCLLPSPVPWDEALERDTLTDLASSDKWHQHASELMQRLDRSA